MSLPYPDTKNRHFVYQPWERHTSFSTDVQGDYLSKEHEEKWTTYLFTCSCIECNSYHSIIELYTVGNFYLKNCIPHVNILLKESVHLFCFSFVFPHPYRPAYLYRFSRDIPILALNHDFPISCWGVPILEDAGIFRAFRFRFVLFSPVFPNPPRILHLPPVKALRCRYK